jgi:hypothetical protein
MVGFDTLVRSTTQWEKRFDPHFLSLGEQRWSYEGGGIYFIVFRCIKCVK